MEQTKTNIRCEKNIDSSIEKKEDINNNIIFDIQNICDIQDIFDMPQIQNEKTDPSTNKVTTSNVSKSSTSSKSSKSSKYSKYSKSAMSSKLSIKKPSKAKKKIKDQSITKAKEKTKAKTKSRNTHNNSSSSKNIDANVINSISSSDDDNDSIIKKKQEKSIASGEIKASKRKRIERERELKNKQLPNISASKKLRPNDIHRIVQHTDNSIFDEEKCCLWTGYITNLKNKRKGTYINFYFREKKKVALHRLLYINFKGEISNKEYIKYSCVNKGRCCNINHMIKFEYNSNDIDESEYESDDDSTESDVDNDFKVVIF